MSLGIMEIVCICIVVLIIWGPKKLPELARALGKAKSEYKKAASAVEQETKDLLEEESVGQTEVDAKKSETSVPGPDLAKRDN